MALIKCYECSKNISDTVKRCPHCGAKNIYKSNVLKKKIIKRRSKFTAWLVAFISSAFAFIFLCFLSAVLGMTFENMPLIVKMIIVFGTFGVYNFVYRSLRPENI